MKKNPFITIGKRKIGIDYAPLVIAEIGINHEGDIEKAKKMVTDAKNAGAECVKFQTHIIEDEMVEAAKSTIPGNAKMSIWDIMERCTLTEAEDMELKAYVESLDMIYLSTPFSRAGAERLKKMKVSAYKIGSGECNNYPLVEHIAKNRKPVILSTGMNDIKAVKEAVKIFRKYKTPYALMHCTSIYPTPYDKIRLGAMTELQSTFKDAVIGLSDHSLDNYACIAASALGASLLERHFTSDKSWPGPDIEISMDPSELSELIKASNAIFQMRGGKKEILKDEKVTIDFAYSCVVSIKDIKQGEAFSAKNIWVKRPGTGEILAKDFNKLIGKKASKNIKSGEQLKRSDVKR